MLQSFPGVSVGRVSAELPYTQHRHKHYLNNIIVPLHEQQRPNFILIDDNAPAHGGPIISERLLETEGSQVKWIPDLNTDVGSAESQSILYSRMT